MRNSADRTQRSVDLSKELVGPPKKQHTGAKKRFECGPQAFLSTVGDGRDIVSFKKKTIVFAQGDSTNGLFFIQKGKVRLSVVSDAGKEATLGILGERDFFGEGSLCSQSMRTSSAIAMTDCVLLHVEREAMRRAIRREPNLSAMFLMYLLRRNIRYQDDLVDQLFNSSEKRLARVLLLMAHFGKEGVSEMSIPRLSQETLAEMVGTTRSRVSFFMNRFRKLGFINYDIGDVLHVHSSLLNVVLRDDNTTIAARESNDTINLIDKGLEPPGGSKTASQKARRSNPSRLKRC